jgi:hypothetical protein
MNLACSKRVGSLDLSINRQRRVAKVVSTKVGFEQEKKTSDSLLFSSADAHWQEGIGVFPRSFQAYIELP